MPCNRCLPEELRIHIQIPTTSIMASSLLQLLNFTPQKCLKQKKLSRHGLEQPPESDYQPAWKRDSI